MHGVAALSNHSRPSAAIGRRRGKQRISGREARSIHAALAQEAYDVSLLIAVTGSIANSIVSNKRPQLRIAIASYLPCIPALFPAAVTSGMAAGALSNQTMQSMIGFYGLVAFARSATESYAERRDTTGGTGPISMDTLGEAWQAAAMQGIGVLTMLGFLDKTSPLYDGNRDNTQALRLIEMLWGVTLGRSPCVRIDGAVIIPGWIERRSHLRREINAPAMLTVDGNQQRVTVRDLSAGGLGIEGAASVRTGDRVSVALNTGVTFEGVAVWNRDGRIGVKLSMPISSPIAAD